MAGSFSVERHGEVTVVRVRPIDRLISIDLEETGKLWEVLHDFRVSKGRALLWLSEAGHMSPESMDRLWERARETAATKGYVKSTGRIPEIARVRTNIEKLLSYLVSLRAPVVIAFAGVVDLHLLGLPLACHYRVCSADTTFLNRIVDSGVTPGSALGWFLPRFIGAGRTEEILLGGRSLTANEALDLGLVSAVVSPNKVEAEGLRIAEQMASRPQEAVESLLRATRFWDRELASFIKNVGVGFDRLPER